MSWRRRNLRVLVGDNFLDSCDGIISMGRGGCNDSPTCDHCDTASHDTGYAKGSVCRRERLRNTVLRGKLYIYHTDTVIEP